jgi:hypothetical protein
MNFVQTSHLTNISFSTKQAYHSTLSSVTIALTHTEQNMCQKTFYQQLPLFTKIQCKRTLLNGHLVTSACTLLPQHYHKHK